MYLRHHLHKAATVGRASHKAATVGRASHKAATVGRASHKAATVGRASAVRRNVRLPPRRDQRSRLYGRTQPQTNTQFTANSTVLGLGAIRADRLGNRYRLIYRQGHRKSSNLNPQIVLGFCWGLKRQGTMGKCDKLGDHGKIAQTDAVDHGGPIDRGGAFVTCLAR